MLLSRTQRISQLWGLKGWAPFWSTDLGGTWLWFQGNAALCLLVLCQGGTCVHTCASPSWQEKKKYKCPLFRIWSDFPKLGKGKIEWQVWELKNNSGIHQKCHRCHKKWVFLLEWLSSQNPTYVQKTPPVPGLTQDYQSSVQTKLFSHLTLQAVFLLQSQSLHWFNISLKPGLLPCPIPEPSPKCLPSAVDDWECSQLTLNPPTAPVQPSFNLWGHHACPLLTAALKKWHFHGGITLLPSELSRTDKRLINCIKLLIMNCHFVFHSVGIQWRTSTYKLTKRFVSTLQSCWEN